ncbi:MAG: glycosyltransferase family 4 protein [Pyrobaculum sp.]
MTKIEIYSDQFNIVGPGGQHRILNVADGLAKMGYNVLLITPFFRTTYNDLLKNPNKYYIDTKRLYFTVKGKLMYYLGNSTILPLATSCGNPGIVVLPSPIFKANVAVIKKACRDIVIADFGDIYFSQNDPYAYKLISSMYLDVILTKYVDYVIVPTRKMLMFFQKLMPHLSSKVIHIPSSINTSIFKPNNPTPNPTIAYIGALTPGRGVELLPAIIKETVKYISDAEFIIIGSGPLEGYLKRAIARFGLSSHARFMGDVDYWDIPKVCRGCWIGLSLYPRESIYPVDILKALTYMSLGMPIVSSVDIEEAEGAAIKVKYSVDEFLRAIIELVRNDELRLTISHKARYIAINKYDNNIITKRYISLFNK